MINDVHWLIDNHGRNYHRALGARAPPPHILDYFETELPT